MNTVFGESENLLEVKNRMKDDAHFAQVTISRRGENLRKWLPRLSWMERKKAYRFARSLKEKPQNKEGETLSFWAKLFRAKSTGEKDKFITGNDEFSRRKEPSVDEVVAHVERGGTYMRRVPPEEEALRSDAESLMEQASKHMQQKQYEKAVETLSKVVRVFPNHFGAYINRGNAYSLLGRPEKAIEDYSRSIAINPSYYIAHVNLAAVYIDMGRKEDALRLYRDVLSKIPADRQTDIKKVKSLMEKILK